MPNTHIKHVQHEYSLNPVTALDFYQSQNGLLLLLVGEGLYLKVYNSDTLQLIGQCEIFASQTVHGIAVCDRLTSEEAPSKCSIRAVVWGGKSYISLSDHQLQSIISGERRSFVDRKLSAPDWILDVAISSTDGSDSCIFVTAHGSALLLDDFNVDSGFGTHLKVVIPPSPAIYYSAHAVWNGSELILALGSVFGEIEVVHHTKGVNRNVCTLTGHEGSIFGVEISPLISIPGGSQVRLLASCSDDRTIRIWNLGSADVSSEFIGESTPNDKKLLLRETGFGDNNHELHTGKEATRLVAMAMGHVSRIWKVKFIIAVSGIESPPSTIDVFSFGEDATCQQWKLQYLSTPAEVAGKKPPTTSLIHLETFAYHSGKHLWSTALSSTGNGHFMVANGGADGKVTINNVSISSQCCPDNDNTHETHSSLVKGVSWNLAEIMGNIPQNEAEDDSTPLVVAEPILSPPESSLLPTIDEQVGGTKKKKKPKKLAKVPEDVINRYAFLSEDRFIATTSSGIVLLASTRNTPFTWTQLRMPAGRNRDLQSYSLITSILNQHAAILVGTSGILYIYVQGKDILEIGKVPSRGKIANLLQIPGCESNSTRLLVTALGSDEAHLLSIDFHNEHAVFGQTRSINLPSGFVVTSAADIAGLIMLGSRYGAIAVYHLETTKDNLLVQIPQKDDQNEAVTAITKVVADTPADEVYFLTSSRGGSYSIHRMSNKSQHFFEGEMTDKLSINPVHRVHPPFASIESAWFQGSILFLSGFRSKSFIVWNETEQLEVLNVDCGGSHRTYAYYPAIPAAARGAGTFLYTKASRIHMHKQDTPSHTVLKPGGHGREIKACAHFDRGIFATGSEDTTIRIWKYHSSKSPTDLGSLKSSPTADNFTCLATIQKHTAGIQALQFSEAGPDGSPFFLYSSSGYEEFHIWSLCEIPSFGLGVILEASLPLELISEDRDLRITAFDTELHYAQQLDNGRQGVVHQITLAYSDSTIKRLRYSISTGFQLSSEGRYTSACLTQLKILHTQSRGGNILTASTDGHIAFWNLAADDMMPPSRTQQLKVMSRAQLHQNSILALDTKIYLSKYFFLLTGGDDNSICLSQYHCQTMQLLGRVIVKDAHCAAVTGVGFISEPTVGETAPHWLRFWTSSIDQVLKRWTVEMIVNPKNDPDQSMNEPKGTYDAVDSQALSHSEDTSAAVIGMRLKEMGVDGLGRAGWETRFSTADCAGLVPFRLCGDRSQVLVFGAGMEVFWVQDN